MPKFVRGELLRQHGTKGATENALADLSFSVYTHGMHVTKDTPPVAQMRLRMFGACTGTLDPGARLVHCGVLPDEVEAITKDGEWRADKEDLFFLTPAIPKFALELDVLLCTFLS